jgi:hypothetical protein
MDIEGAIMLWLWYIVYAIQTFLSFGTAYRLTKNGGDDGPSLFGWLFVMNLAAIIPGLGFYLWFKCRDKEK